MNANELVLSIWDRKNGRKSDWSGWLTLKQTTYLADLSNRRGSNVHSSSHGPKGNVGYEYYGSLYEKGEFIGDWHLRVSPANGCGTLSVNRAGQYEARAYMFKYDNKVNCYDCWSKEVLGARKLSVIDRGIRLEELEKGAVVEKVTEQPRCQTCGNNLRVEQVKVEPGKKEEPEKPAIEPKKCACGRTLEESELAFGVCDKCYANYLETEAEWHEYGQYDGPDYEYENYSPSEVF